VSAAPALAPDAAMVLGIASTAMPFARTPEDEVERWLRLLRSHGQVGIELQALGVSEVPLDVSEVPLDVSEVPLDVGDGSPGAHPQSSVASGGPRDPVGLVSEHALRIAGERDAQTLATIDVLLAVMQVYGEDFDRVLHVHGVEREQLLARLCADVSSLED
jgi:hypothetical protein